MNFQEFKDFVIEGVEVGWKNDKQIASVVFFLIAEEDATRVYIVPVDHFFQTTFHKDVLSGVIENVCKELDVISYSVVSESWMASLNKEEFDADPGKVILPSEHPNRREIILMLFETRFNTETYYYEVIRDENSAVISDLKNLPGSDLKGRFSKLLMDMASMN